MAFLSRVYYNGDGATANFSLTFSIQQNSDLEVYVDDVLKTEATHYNISGSTVTFTGGNIPASGTSNVLLKRVTPTVPRVDFANSGIITEAKLDKQSLQNSYVVEEVKDDNQSTLSLDTSNNWDATNYKIINVADPTSDQHAATKTYVDLVAAGTYPAPLSIANGGTNATTAAAARTSLDVYSTGAVDTAIAAEATARSADIDDLSGVTDPETARTNLEVDRPVQSKSTTYAQVATDVNNMIRFTAAGSYTLLAAATAGNDFSVDLMADGGAITIDPNGAETVNGSATHTVNDGTSGTLFCDGSAWYFLAGGGGGGSYKGENGTIASTSVGDIFRVHEQELNTDVTIAATENALCAGPLTVATGVTLTITSGGNLAIV